MRWAFDRTLFGVSLKITGDVQYNLTAKGNVKELHKAVLRMAVNTAVKMSDIDSGKVFVSGALVSGDEKVSASDVFDGKDGEVEVKNIIQKNEGVRSYTCSWFSGCLVSGRNFSYGSWCSTFSGWA